MSAISIAVLISVELFLIFNSNKKVSSGVNKVLTKMTTDEVKALIKEEKSKHDGKRFVFVNNILCDVTEYIDTHPGGANLISENLYNDVSKYLNGSVPYNSKVKAHEHSYLTCLHIINNLSFAEIHENHNLVLSSDNSSMYLNDNMIVSNSRVIGSNYKEFCLTLKNSEKLKSSKFSRYNTGLSWMGKHYSFISDEINKNRLYSICLALDDVIAKHHERIVNNVLKLENNESINANMLNEEEKFTNELKIYVKNYETPNSFSNQLHIGKIKELNVSGPIGLGLNISNIQNDYISKENVFLFFSAGTGIFFFLDFIAFVIRKICYEASVKMNCKNNLLNDEDADNLKTNVKLILFCSFNNEENAIWHSLILKAQEINDKYNLGLLKYNYRISSQSKQRLSKEDYSKEIEKFEKVSKCYICGPASYMDDIKECLNGIIDQDRIVLL